ncbi:histidine phosphatase family protein [Caulobacter sp. KR2-114]|uniref:histidine phosphatase family protein n=1 Tax=Caulobacter sp. KR2-114 TaxID=3400912 RepID=UPI003C0E4E5E
MIYLIRHGQTEFNRDHKLQGRIDSPLTALGVDQARQVGAWFAPRIAAGGAWRIVASPLGRTQATARLIAEAAGLGGGFDTDERLIELSIGSWEGLARPQIEALRPDLAGQPFFMHSPDGEPWQAAAARLGDFPAEHAAGPDNILAVTHAGAGKVMRGVHLGLTLEEVRHLDVPQDAVFALTPGAIERFDC